MPHNPIRCFFIRCFSVRCFSIRCFFIRCFIRRSHSVLPLQVSKLCLFTPHCLLLHPAPNKKIESCSAFGKGWKLCFISPSHDSFSALTRGQVLLCLALPWPEPQHCAPLLHPVSTHCFIQRFIQQSIPTLPLPDSEISPSPTSLKSLIHVRQRTKIHFPPP